MEQYFMPKESDFENLRLCLDNYLAESISIGDCGGFNPDGTYRLKGKTKISECLEGRFLDFKKDKSGLYIIIDSEEVFHFPLDDYGKGFSLEYERKESTGEGRERIVVLGRGTDPYDPELPKPRKSFLKNVFDDHLIEICFRGRVYLKEFSYWRENKFQKYWCVDTKAPL